MDCAQVRDRGDNERREPGVLQFMGSQRVGHDLATEQEREE